MLDLRRSTCSELTSMPLPIASLLCTMLASPLLSPVSRHRLRGPAGRRIGPLQRKNQCQPREHGWRHDDGRLQRQGVRRLRPFSKQLPERTWLHQLGMALAPVRLLATAAQLGSRAPARACFGPGSLEALRADSRLRPCRPEVLATPTADLGKILSAMHKASIGGESDLYTGIQIAQVSSLLGSAAPTRSDD